jgi:mRNA interferase RelE/StbE
MSYEIAILRRASKELAKLPQNDYKKINIAINNLAINPRPSGCKKLKGRLAWRIRVGDYRIIYEISDQKLIIVVIDVGHRRDIYR